MGTDGKNGLDYSDQWNLLSGIQMNYNLSLSNFFFRDANVPKSWNMHNLYRIFHFLSSTSSSMEYADIPSNVSKVKEKL